MSPQSSSPSHFQPWGLQRVLLHWNSSFGQCLITEGRGMEKKKKRHLKCYMRPWAASLSGVSLSHRRCRISPRRYRPNSQRQRRSAIAAGCSGCFCTGTGRCHTSPRSRSVWTARTACERQQGGDRLPLREKRRSDTSSDPSTQSWSPSHFQRPAMQRPLVQANSLSEHCRGTEEHTGESQGDGCRGETSGGGGVVGKKQGEV